MEYRKYIEELLSPFRVFGLEKLNDGTELIGEAKFVAPMAYLHSLFPPLETTEIDQISQKLKAELPSELKSFFQEFNGFNLFGTSFCIHGLRHRGGRSIDAVRQPFDIYQENISERIKDASDEMIFIGSYSWDGSKIYINANTGRICSCSRRSTLPLASWPSFETFLDEEIRRLIDHHTPDGKNIPFRPTVPVGGEPELELLIKLAKKNPTPPYWFKEGNY